MRKNQNLCRLVHATRVALLHSRIAADEDPLSAEASRAIEASEGEGTEDGEEAFSQLEGQIILSQRLSVAMQISGDSCACKTGSFCVV
jgi:hypothetical protein